MENLKKITLRLTENEHKKLTGFAKKQKLSVNNIVRKAIECNFNLNTKEMFSPQGFLSMSQPKVSTEVDKVMLHAVLEILMIMRGTAPSDVVSKSQEIARTKVEALTE